jgi:membrane protein
MTGPLRRFYRTGRETVSAYGRHADSQFAAAISYRVLFSVVPFLAVLVSVLDLVLPQSTEQDLVHWLFGALPGTELEASVNKAVEGAGVSASLVGLVSLGVLLWAAGGMMASIRTAFRIIWETDRGQPYVRGKLLDVALVLGAGVLVVAAFGLSVVSQIAVAAGSDLTSALGWHGEGRAFGGVAEIATSVFVIFVAVLLVYRMVPPVRVSWRGVWPAALVVAVAFHLVMAGFSFYLAHLASYSSVYGSLGALFAFLVLVYLLASLLLMGAEITRLRQR